MHFTCLNTNITRVFPALLSILLLQFVFSNISNIFKNLLNLVARRDFVTIKSSAIMFSIEVYLNSIISSSITFLIQWYLTSMCFVRRWYLEFLMNVITSWLSIKSLIEALIKYACDWINNKRSQTASLFVSVEITYFASQNDWMTRSYRFKLHEIKSSNKK